MIIPELPAYLESMGGGHLKGYIIALFTLTAGLSRPFSGKIADNAGRVPVIIFGIAVSVACAVLYAITTGVFVFLLLRLVHGMSTGFTPTGVSAYIADVVPPNKRGEAMGYVGLAGSIGMAAGPLAGSSIALHLGLDAMFYASAVVGVLSILLLFRLPETLSNPQTVAWGMLKINRHEIFEKTALPAAIVIALTSVGFGTVLTLAPDKSSFLGISNKGLIFASFTLSSLLVRVVAGRISDIYGRIKPLYVSTLLIGFSMLLMGLAPNTFWFMTAGVLFGLGIGINSPTLFAWAIDRCEQHHYGRALATVFIGLEVGIGAGSLISAGIYSNRHEWFAPAFGLSVFTCLLAFAFLISWQRKKTP